MKYVDIAAIDVDNGPFVEVPFIQLIGALFARGAVGVLRLMRFKNEKEVFFLNGIPVYVRSNLSTEALGNILLKKGMLKREDRDMARDMMMRDKIREGEALIKMGKITEDQLYEHLALQMNEMVMSCLEWKSGRYEFESRDIDDDPIELFDVNPFKVIYEGIKRFVQSAELMPLIRDMGDKFIRLSTRYSEHANLVEAALPNGSGVEVMQDCTMIGQVIPKLNTDVVESGRTILAMLTSGLAVLGDAEGFEEVELKPLEIRPRDYYPPRDFGVEEEEEEEQVEPRVGKEKKSAPEDLPAFEIARLARQAELQKEKQEQGGYSLGSEEIKADVLRPEEPAESAKPETDAQSASSKSRRKKKADPLPQAEIDRMIEYATKGDYYKILGLNDESILPDIREAHYNLSKKYDVVSYELDDVQTEAYERILEAVNEAYETFKDHNLRKEYEGREATREQEYIGSDRERFILADKYFKRGKRYLSIDDWGEAERYFLWSMSLNPSRADYPCYLGWAQFKQYAKFGLASSHDISDPIDHVRLALSIDNQHATAHYFLGYIMKQLGNTEKALEHLQRATECDPDLKEAKAELKSLKRRM